MKFKLVDEDESKRSSVEVDPKNGTNPSPVRPESVRGGARMSELRNSTTVAKNKQAADIILKMRLRKEICLYSEQLDKKDVITNDQMKRAAEVLTLTL